MKPADIKARLDRTGRKHSALAAHLGISKDSVSRLVNGQRDPSYDEVQAIEKFFADDAETGPRLIDIPVFGYAAAGGEDRVALANDAVLEHIKIPEGLAKGEIMAIRVAGDSMEPRLFAGEVVIVGRNLGPARDRDCVVEFRDGTAVVKQYQGQREGFIFLRQFNPDKEVRYDATKVRAVHAVLYRR